MKKFTRIIERGGRKYAYEVTPHYDPGIKNTRQKTRYLGVYEDGTIKRKRSSIPVCVFDYGEFVPLLKIVEELDIEKNLASLLSESHARTVLALALNRITNPVTACNAQVWYEGTYLSKTYGPLPLSSQNISRLMGALGDSAVPRDFSKRFIRNIGAGQPLLYDITSLSSSSRFMDILEFGHNKDGDGLPQLNLSIVAHKDKGIPLCFDTHPGSVVDVSTLKNTARKLRSLGLKEPTLILDRGFFSETNIGELCETGLRFILPASFASKSVASLVSNTAPSDIERPENLRMFNGTAFFVKPVVLRIGRRDIDGYLFYDMEREKDEKSRFYKKLHDVAEAIKKRKLRSYEKADKVFEDIAGAFVDCFTWKAAKGRFTIEMVNDAVARKTFRMGFTVILYRGEFSWDEILAWNRERDIIEKMFMQLKSDLDAKPMRVQSTEAAKGWIFVAFLALIIRCRLTKMLIETKLAEKYSIPSLLLTLGRLKQVELSDGSMMRMEITKAQRDILKALGMDA